MAFYKAKQMKQNGKFYPVAILVDEPMDIEEIAEQIAAESTVSKADALAVFASLPHVMARGMNAGRSVHIPYVGHFRYTAAARKGGKDKAEDVSADDILRARIRFVPETRYQGDAATRALAPSLVHWTRWDGAEQTDPSAGEGEDEDETGGSEPLG